MYNHEITIKSPPPERVVERGGDGASECTGAGGRALGELVEGEEEALERRQVLEPREDADAVAPQVELEKCGERRERGAVELLELVARQVEHSQRDERGDVLEFRELQHVGGRVLVQSLREYKEARVEASEASRESARRAEECPGAHAVGVEVEHFEGAQRVETLNACDPIAAEHENAKVSQKAERRH